MPKSHKAYPEEFKRRLVEMVRAGRSPEDLADKFEPTAQSIRNWVAQAELDAVALALNTRPRKTLGWRTPAEALDEHLQSMQHGDVATTD